MPSRHLVSRHISFMISYYLLLPITLFFRQRDFHTVNTLLLLLIEKELKICIFCLKNAPGEIFIGEKFI